MKKLLLFAIAALVLGGCTEHKESDEPQRVSVILPTSVSATTEAVSTRTEANSTNHILWVANDKISLFPGVDHNTEYRLKGGLKVENGEFERITTDATALGTKLNGFYGVYPYSESAQVSYKGVISLSLPATQKYAKNSFGNGANVMVAHRVGKQSEPMQFKSVGGFVRVMLYGANATVKSCSIKGNNGEIIAGEATVEFVNGDEPQVTMANNEGTTVTLDCGSGVKIGESETTATPFWFALPAMTLADGYTVEVVDNNNVLFSKKISTALTIARGEVQSTEAIKTRLSGDGLEIVGDKVRFYLSEAADGFRSKCGIAPRNWTASSVLVNNKPYTINFDEDDTPYVDVEINSANSYAAALLTSESSSCYGDTPYVGIKLSHSQFYGKSKSMLSAFPMYAAYSVTTGNHFVFRDAFALIHLKMKGSANIVSVKAENLSGGVLAGPATVNRNTGAITLSRGMSFVALNCTENGSCVALNKNTPTDFYLLTAPKACSKGLKISVCDSERLAMFHTLDITELEAGHIYSIEKDYAPEANMVFYEGFDTFVWGGDIAKGTSGKGYSPDDTTIDISSCTGRTGYEEALTEVPYDNPGSCFVQPNNWNSVNNYMVDTSHQVSDSYIKSRHLSGTQYMFRVQEHPGYIAIGTASTARGIYSSPMMRGVKGCGDIKVKIRFALQAGFNGTLQASISYGGVITEANLNGSTIALTSANNNCSSSQSTLLFNASQLNIASTPSAAKPWNTLELTVSNTADGARLYFADQNSASGIHGIYLDTVEAYQINEWASRPANTLRVLLWNIQNGMWADQHNNYNNFVKWVQKYDPDICIWCESETIYNDKTNKAMATDLRYLPAGWSNLCTRYGHAYAATGGNRDNYSQTVTSKYPITTLQRITGPSSKPIAHGAGHFTVTVNGKKINIVSLHMHPQAYAYGVSGDAAREESAKNKGGDYYRQYEMQYIVDATVNNASYKSEELWLLGGDTNSRSRKDAWNYSYASDDPIYLTHDVVLGQTDLKDVIADYYPGHYFFSSTGGNSRIDMLYASPAMFSRIQRTISLMDSWTNACNIHELCLGWSSNQFRDPSDHRPILVDFNME